MIGNEAATKRTFHSSASNRAALTRRHISLQAPTANLLACLAPLATIRLTSTAAAAAHRGLRQVLQANAALSRLHLATADLVLRSGRRANRWALLQWSSCWQDCWVREQ